MRYEKYCAECDYVYSDDLPECPVCQSTLVLREIKKKESKKEKKK